MIGFILGLLIVGLIAGALARLLVPGRQNISIPATILVGIIGSFVGGFPQQPAVQRRRLPADVGHHRVGHRRGHRAAGLDQDLRLAGVQALTRLPGDGRRTTTLAT